VKDGRAEIKMRIVHVCPPTVSGTFHPGGVETYVYELAKCLTSRGHEVAIYTSHMAQNPDRKVNEIEMHYFPVLEPSDYPVFLQESRIVCTITERMWLPKHLFTYFNRLSEEHDVLHMHGHEYISNFLATLAAKKGRIPTVLTIHGSEIGIESLLPVHLLRKIARRTTFFFTIHSADAIIASNDLAVNLTMKYQPKQVVEIPLGIDLDRYENHDLNPEYVLFLGRLFPEKGAEIFIRSIPHVLKKTEINFVIAGYGPQRSFLEELSNKLGVNEYVTFLGKVPHDEVPSVMSRAFVMVAPGNAAYTLLEAASMNVPIVSAKLAWNVSTIGEDNALFVEPGNEKALAEAIMKILSNHKLAEDLSKRAKRYVVANRSWKVLVPRFERLYKQVLEGKS